MKMNILKVEEIFIWFLTYFTLVTFFLTCIAFYGEIIKNFLESRDKITVFSSSDIKFIERNYGQENSAYIYINNVLDFINSYIPSNIFTLLFLCLVYILYFFTVKYIEISKPSRNSYIVYFANALSSIASSVSSLIIFITSILFLGLIFVCSIGLVGGYVFWLLLVFIVIYSIISVHIFLLDKSLANLIRESVL